MSKFVAFVLQGPDFRHPLVDVSEIAKKRYQRAGGPENVPGLCRQKIVEIFLARYL